MAVHITKYSSATVSNAAAALNFKKRIISNCKIWVETTVNLVAWGPSVNAVFVIPSSKIHD